MKTGDKKMRNITDKSRTARTIKSGFTLIEMLIVVLIVAILAAIALPQYNTSVERAKMAEAVTLTKQIAEANKRYYMATGAYANSISELDISIPGEPYGDRVQTKNFIYTASAEQEYLALTQRIPFAERYYIYISKDNSSNNKIRCTSYAYAAVPVVQKKLCAQLNAKGTI